MIFKTVFLRGQNQSAAKLKPAPSAFPSSTIRAYQDCDCKYQAQVLQDFYSLIGLVENPLHRTMPKA